MASVASFRTSSRVTSNRSGTIDPSIGRSKFSFILIHPLNSFAGNDSIGSFIPAKTLQPRDAKCVHNCKPSAVSALVIKIVPPFGPINDSRVPRTLHSKYNNRPPAIENKANNCIPNTSAVDGSMCALNLLVKMLFTWCCTEKKQKTK